MGKDMVHICNGILFSHKKWNNATCSNMNATRDDHTKWSKSEGEMPHDVTHLWNRKYGTNEPTHETETDLANKLLVARVKGGGGGMDWEFGVGRCKLSCLEWIHNKVLLYSTRNYIQYPEVNNNGKEYKKTMSVWVRAESLWTAEIGTTLQISYISKKINKICPPNSHITATEAWKALRRPGVLRFD